MDYNNEIVFLQLLSEIDEKHIRQAENGIAVREVRIRKRPLALAAVVILSVILGISVCAAVVRYLSHRENVSHEYGYNSVLLSELEKRAVEPIVCENEHLRLTVDTIIADEIYIRAAATLEGKDDLGNKFISDELILAKEMNGSDDTLWQKAKSDKDQFIPYMTAYSQDGRYLAAFNTTADNMYGKKGDSSEAAFSFGIARSALKGEKSIRVQCDQLSTHFSSGDAGIFKNMSFIMPVESNFNTLMLRTKDDKKTVYLSETCFYENEDFTQSGSFSLSVRYKNGKDIEDIKSRFIERELYRLEKIEYVEYNGERYYPSEIIRSNHAE